MDPWMHRPGGRVVGHRAVVRGRDDELYVACTCGHVEPARTSLLQACVLLVEHLQREVRAGARVVYDERDGGDAGVREPRRPRPPSGSGTLALDRPAP